MQPRSNSAQAQRAPLAGRGLSFSKIRPHVSVLLLLPALLALVACGGGGGAGGNGNGGGEGSSKWGEMVWGQDAWGPPPSE